METACPALYSAGAAAFELKRVATTPPSLSHRLSSAACRARANPEARGRGPVAAMAALLPAAGNPHICSGKSIASELRAVPPPSSGRTHRAGRLTVGEPASSPRFRPEIGKPRGHVYPEIRMLTWK